MNVECYRKHMEYIYTCGNSGLHSFGVPIVSIYKTTYLDLEPAMLRTW